MRWHELPVDSAPFRLLREGDRELAVPAGLEVAPGDYLELREVARRDERRSWYTGRTIFARVVEAGEEVDGVLPVVLRPFADPGEVLA